MQRVRNEAKFAELSQSIGIRESVFGSVIKDNNNTFRDTIQSAGRSVDSRQGFPAASPEVTTSSIFEKKRTSGEDAHKSLERLNSVKRQVFEAESDEGMTLQTDYHQNALPVKSTTGSMAFRKTKFCE